jgi:hypothetical protein
MQVRPTKRRFDVGIEMGFLNGPGLDPGPHLKGLDPGPRLKPNADIPQLFDGLCGLGSNHLRTAGIFLVSSLPDAFVDIYTAACR